MLKYSTLGPVCLWQCLINLLIIDVLVRRWKGVHGVDQGDAVGARVRRGQGCQGEGEDQDPHVWGTLRKFSWTELLAYIKVAVIWCLHIGLEAAHWPPGILTLSTTCYLQPIRSSRFCQLIDGYQSPHKNVYWIFWLARRKDFDNFTRFISIKFSIENKQAKQFDGFRVTMHGKTWQTY